MSEIKKTSKVVPVVAIAIAILSIGFGIYSAKSANSKVAAMRTITTGPVAETRVDNVVSWKQGQDLLIQSILGVDINLTNKDDSTSNKFPSTTGYTMADEDSVGYETRVFGKLNQPNRTRLGENKDGGSTDLDIIFDNSGRNVYYNTQNPISGTPNAAGTDEIQYINGVVPPYVASAGPDSDYAQKNPKLPPINWSPDEVIHAVRVYDITNLVDRIPCPWTEKEGVAVNLKNQVVRFLDPKRAKREGHHVTGYWEDDHNLVNVAVPKFITGSDGIRCHISGDAFVISLDPDTVARQLWECPDALKDVLTAASDKDIDWDAFERALEIVKNKKAKGETFETTRDKNYVVEPEK